MTILTLSTGGPSEPYSPKVANAAGVVQTGYDTQPVLAVEALGGAPLALEGGNLAAILAKLTADPALGAGQTTTNTKLTAILAALQAQLDIATLFLTDNGNPAQYYVRRESVNEGTGALTVTIENIDGTIPSPVPTGLTPIVAAVSGGSPVPIDSEATFFDVVTAATGYALTDVLARVVFTNTSTGAVTSTWQNITQGTTLAGAPAAANVIEQTRNIAVTSTVLATNASTAANQASILAALGLVATAAKQPAPGTAGTPSADVLSVQGSAGGMPIATQVFTPIRRSDGTAANVRLTVGTAKTTNPVALPAIAGANAYRARVPAQAQYPVTFIVTTDNTRSPVIPVAYDATGANGTPGDKTIDPGGVEVFGLSTAQQTALAAGTLYLTAIATGASEINILTGTGA